MASKSEWTYIRVRPKTGFERLDLKTFLQGTIWDTEIIPGPSEDMELVPKVFLIMLHQHMNLQYDTLITLRRELIKLGIPMPNALTKDSLIKTPIL